MMRPDDGKGWGGCARKKRCKGEGGDTRGWNGRQTTPRCIKSQPRRQHRAHHTHAHAHQGRAHMHTCKIRSCALASECESTTAREAFADPARLHTAWLPDPQRPASRCPVGCVHGEGREAWQQPACCCSGRVCRCGVGPRWFPLSLACRVLREMGRGSGELHAVYVQVLSGRAGFGGRLRKGGDAPAAELNRMPPPAAGGGVATVGRG